MKKVKGSRQYPMIVVPYRPFYHAFCRLLVAILFIVSVLVSGYLGHDKGIKTSSKLESENRQLKDLYEEKQIELDELQQQVANLTVGSQVDRKAEEGIRAEMVVLRERVAELEQETTFYRELMKPNADNSGLTIGSLDILKTNTPRLYKYKLVIQQLAAQHQLLKGYLEFTIVGRQIGEDSQATEQTVPLKDISKDVSVVRIPMRFKYFQRLEGELELPVKFEPEVIEIKAVSTVKGSAAVEKKFSWLVQEI